MTTTDALQVLLPILAAIGTAATALARWVGSRLDATSRSRDEQVAKLQSSLDAAAASRDEHHKAALAQQREDTRLVVDALARSSEVLSRATAIVESLEARLYDSPPEPTGARKRSR